MQPSNYCPGQSLWRNENLSLPKNLYVDVCSNFILNSQKLEVIQIFFSGEWFDNRILRNTTNFYS